MHLDPLSDLVFLVFHLGLFLQELGILLAVLVPGIPLAVLVPGILLAVSVPNWQEFDKIKNSLIADGFEKDKAKHQRFYYGDYEEKE